ARFAPGEPVTFSSVGSEDPDGDDLTLAWKSDLDGILGTGIGIDVILSEGVHTVTLTVTDELDAIAIASVLVEVRLYLPSLFISDLVHDGTSPIEGDTITITAKVGNEGEADAEGVIVRLFVDGVDVYSDLVTVVVDGETTVSYPWTSDEGAHTIRVEVADVHDELSLTVAANNPPTAVPVVEEERKYKPGEQVRFLAEADDADGDALTYVWDFGDGSPVATDRDPSHVFEQAGTYTVTLELTDGRGGTTTATVEVVVKKPKEDESPGFGAALVLVALAVTLVLATRRR
ncbi:MAG: PKD domain-containing protein, partial [Thermoplasmata archaeon]|nr:PKD domain-containing protein [Thermoplasmata archaeon]